MCSGRNEGRKAEEEEVRREVGDCHLLDFCQSLARSCKQPWPDPTPSDTRNWHSNRLLAMSLDACGRLQSWMGEKSKPFELFELFELPDLQLLPQSPLKATASRCLKCLSTNKLLLLPPSSSASFSN